MRPPGRKAQLTILLLAAVLGVSLGAALRGSRAREARPLAVVEVDETAVNSLAGELARRGGSPANRAPGAGALEDGAPDEGRLRRTPLDEEEVRALMPLDKPRRQWDPYSYFRSRPYIQITRRWAEYPDGRFQMRTNSLGLRMDDEPAESRPDLRVLLVGDSHMAGVCTNADCAAGRLEAILARADEERSVEVLNGSEGAYTFYHYLGVLERMIALDITPDVLVVVVYGGNDFLGVFLWHVFNGTPRLKRTPEHLARMRKVAEAHSPALGQVVNAADYFTRGGQAEIANALTMAEQATDEIARLCAEHGIRPVIAYLPAPHEVPGAADLTHVDAAIEGLGLDRSALDLVGSLGDAYLDRVRAQGIPTIDLRDTFRDAERELYWRADLHLNLVGHALVAEALAPAVEAAWRRR